MPTAAEKKQTDAGLVAPIITDFTPGPGGDLLDLSATLSMLAGSGYVSGTDPFATGWLRLTASSMDTLLEVDTTGSAAAGLYVVAALEVMAAVLIVAFIPRRVSD